MHNEDLSNNNLEQQVLDPSDPEYKGNMYFKQNRQSVAFNGNYHFSCRLQGCGCAMGCFVILIISFIITAIIWWAF
ncbi:hypothetical protein [Staphylococcus simiae]|uniref:Uncharacterized protein n=1 Tax=Staphylococcus simiae CCM 7213 = CCUG 51256 TaxID=911238 RepID=G5JFW4_9STAP|nr:hypothetical protein [Staphylococcus simiae]EHJ08912.1 hypothetical protein SS7213T_01641 [Staphylococcus simiae CCM 7213 = CCUG 51256]PNZ13987.1 hypothetical protein CD113_03340 [Staphylococcus simiae]SNV65031.1 Uncharacterised protein [Staphylococcus simiae]